MNRHESLMIYKVYDRKLKKKCKKFNFCVWSKIQWAVWTGKQSIKVNWLKAGVLECIIIRRLMDIKIESGLK